MALPPAEFQPGLALQLCLRSPWDVDCLGRGFEEPRKRMGRKLVKGEIWLERDLFFPSLGCLQGQGPDPT